MRRKRKDDASHIAPLRIRKRKAIDDDDTVFRVPEVARLLRINVVMAYALCRNGTIPSLRLGASVRVPKGPFRAWMKSGMKVSSDSTA